MYGCPNELISGPGNREQRGPVLDLDSRSRILLVDVL